METTSWRVHLLLRLVKQEGDNRQTKVLPPPFDDLQSFESLKMKNLQNKSIKHIKYRGLNL